MNAGIMENSMDISLKSKNRSPPYYPSVPLLGTYPAELKPADERGACVPTFVPVLFAAADVLSQLQQAPLGGVPPPPLVRRPGSCQLPQRMEHLDREYMQNRKHVLQGRFKKALKKPSR